MISKLRNITNLTLDLVSVLRGAQITAGLALVLSAQLVMAQSYLVSGTAEAPLRGAYEVTLTATPGITNGFLQNDLRVTFTRDNGTQVTTNGFYDGGNTFKARAYLDSVGDWSWTSSSANAGLNSGSGSFTVVNNVDLPGKLRKSNDDPRQFVQDNGQWFLHLGDTGYRYINSQEPHWQAYIDQAAGTGFTKIRTWFGSDASSGVASIDYMLQGNSLNLSELQTADQRLTYALNNHPEMQMQLIPFGSDPYNLRKYANNDPLVRAYAREVQARYGALPNVHWCLSNDRRLTSDESDLVSVINTLGTDWNTADAWGTLITNHQHRFSGYSFVNAPWSDIVTIEDQDQVTGAKILSYRSGGAQDPIVNDEDRYESWRAPSHDRYFFRRLMWGSLLSGGAATYGGGQTWTSFVSTSQWQGIQGYNDLNNAGLLQGGADDFKFIHKFFDDTHLDLIGLAPDDALVGGNAKNFKAIRGDDVLIAYLANPTGTTPGTDNASSSTPNVTIAPSLDYGDWFGSWFNPTNGSWRHLGQLDNANRTFTAPGGNDWLLLLSEQDISPKPAPPKPFQDDATTRGLWHMDQIDNLGGGAPYQDFIDDDNTYGAPDRDAGRELLLGLPDASSHPTLTPGAPGMGDALLFDGVDDVAIASDVWGDAVDRISIDFLMRPESLPDVSGDNFMATVNVLPVQTYLQDDGSGNGTGSLVTLAFHGSGIPLYGYSQGGLALGEWHDVHVEVTNTGGANGFGVLSLTVDGVTSSYDMPDSLANSAAWESSAVIGRQMTALDRYFHGALDEIRIATDPYVSPLIPGDANGDGNVDVSDLGILATNYGTIGGADWGDADFTGDGLVDVSDLGILATNYGATSSSVAVPEPAVFRLLLLGGVLVCGMSHTKVKLGGSGE